MSSLSASEMLGPSASLGPAPEAEAPRVAAPADAPIAIRVKDVHVTYRTSLQKTPTLKETLLRMGRRQTNVREVKALRGVSFDVPHGRVMGVIGSNGAGKSTLMRTVAGILAPSRGRIEVTGRVSTLLALGVGFNGKLSGRENVMLGGLAAGLTRVQVDERYQEIAEFAELGDFMDMPMRAYSSGMYSRLAFAVAVHMDPDILIIDEALSAGDAAFKKKAADKMQELVGKARTMMVVSHALGTIRDLCDEVVWLHQGRVIRIGPPEQMIAAYTKFLKVGDESVVLEDF